MNRAEFYVAFEALREIHKNGHSSGLINKVSETNLNIVSDIISKGDLLNREDDFIIPYENYYDYFILDKPLIECI
jgi:hypothetical protein